MRTQKPNTQRYRIQHTVRHLLICVARTEVGWEWRRAFLWEPRIGSQEYWVASKMDDIFYPNSWFYSAPWRVWDGQRVWDYSWEGEEGRGRQFMGGAGSGNPWQRHCKIPCETWWGPVPCTNISPIAQTVSSLWTIALTMKKLPDSLYLSNSTWAFGFISESQCLVSCLHSRPLLSSNSFEHLALTSKSLIHSEIAFGSGVRHGSNFILLCVDGQLFPCPLSNRLSFPYGCFGHLCGKSVGGKCLHPFRGSLYFSWPGFLFLCQCHTDEGNECAKYVLPQSKTTKQRHI